MLGDDLFGDNKLKTDSKIEKDSPKLIDVTEKFQNSIVEDPTDISPFSNIDNSLSDSLDERDSDDYYDDLYDSVDEEMNWDADIEDALEKAFSHNKSTPFNSKNEEPLQGDFIGDLFNSRKPKYNDFFKHFDEALDKSSNFDIPVIIDDEINLLTPHTKELRDELIKRGDKPRDSVLFEFNLDKTNKIIDKNLTDLKKSLNNVDTWIKFQENILETQLDDINHLYAMRSIVDRCIDYNQKILKNVERNYQTNNLFEKSNELEKYSLKLNRFLSINKSIVAILKEENIIK